MPVGFDRLPSDTFVKEKVSYTPRKMDVEIGDSKESSFYPQLKTLHWNNEVNFSIRLVDSDYAAGVVMQDAEGRITWARGNRVARLYELTDASFEDGVMEFDVVLNTKPADNVLEFSVQSKGLVAYFQPELTPEDIAAGASRDERFQKSWAIYHAEKRDNFIGGNEYRTGKVLHIPRPYAEDALGTRVWCDFDLNMNGISRLTIPQDFLDKAVYPVVVDPTFGYTTLGATADSSFYIAARIIGSIYVIRQTGRAFSVSSTVYVDSISASVDADGSEDLDIAVAIFAEDSGGAGVHDLIVRVQKPLVSVSTTERFETFLTSQETLVAGSYIIAAMGDANDLTVDREVRMMFDVGATGNIYRETFTDFATGLAENPWTIAGVELTNMYSIYVTYGTGRNMPGELGRRISVGNGMSMAERAL